MLSTCVFSTCPLPPRLCCLAVISSRQTTQTNSPACIFWQPQSLWLMWMLLLPNTAAASLATASAAAAASYGKQGSLLFHTITEGLNCQPAPHPSFLISLVAEASHSQCVLHTPCGDRWEMWLCDEMPTIKTESSLCTCAFCRCLSCSDPILFTERLGTIHSHVWKTSENWEGGEALPKAENSQIMFSAPYAVYSN